MKEVEDSNISITINNKNISDINYNSKILYVTQDSYMFYDSIINNISLGEKYTEDLLDEVIDCCCLRKFINQYGFDKIIDNQDSNISGGEKQRLSLARMLIRKPSLILLDEVTASLDEATANILASNIYNYCKKYNITAVAISHKNEFNKYANKLIEL